MSKLLGNELMGVKIETLEKMSKHPYFAVFHLIGVGLLALVDERPVK